MTVLKTDFAEGDVLWALSTTSTSGVNGITYLVNNTPPIGTILAWAKNLTGVPSLLNNWVECNGQVLSDAESPLNGQTIPNLNGSGGTQRFLRGSTTSGSTGGSETHHHTQNATSGTGYSSDNAGKAHGVDTSDTSTLPSYYEVVYIMKVK